MKTLPKCHQPIFQGAEVNIRTPKIEVWLCTDSCYSHLTFWGHKMSQDKTVWKCLSPTLGSMPDCILSPFPVWAQVSFGASWTGGHSLVHLLEPQQSFPVHVRGTQHVWAFHDSEVFFSPCLFLLSQEAVFPLFHHLQKTLSVDLSSLKFWGALKYLQDVDQHLKGILVSLRHIFWLTEAFWCKELT